MAVHESDTLSEIFPEWRLNDREVTWLWLAVEIQEGIQMDECVLNSPTMRNQIARALANNPRTLSRLDRARDRKLLPEDAFSRVDRSGRQPKWLVTQATKRTGLNIRSSAFLTLTERDQLIALLDLWDKDLGQKDSALRRLLDAWTEHARGDKIFSWFKDKDERPKCDLAWSWLEKNKSRLTWRTDAFKRHSELLEFFDHCDATAEEKELYVEKIKRRWSMQKTREKAATEKKQYNFVLTHSTNATLDRLAEEHQISRTKVIEKLLMSEAERGLYLSPRKTQDTPTPETDDLGGAKSGAKF